MDVTVELYVSYCTPTTQAKKQSSSLSDLLTIKGVSFQEYDVGYDESRKGELKAMTGSADLPKLLVNGASIGTYDDIIMLEESGQLDALLGL